MEIAYIIAILAWIFLREELTWQEVVGMGLAAVGVLIVQIRTPTVKEE